MQMWTSWCASYKSVAQKIIGSNLKKKGWIHMGNNDSSVETFLQWIKASDNIVFFGGAGVSTESGIPDFRRDRKSTRLNSSHTDSSRMPSSA